MILKFLGRGSAFNVKEGNNSAYLKEGNKLLLIDCGESVFERIINKRLLDDVQDIDILITHLDSDHIGSLSSLIYYCYYIKHITAKIYFPNVDLFNLLKMQGHTEGTDYRFIELEMKESKFQGFGGVTPIKVEHMKTLNCYGYLMNIKEKLIWYSGDTSNVSNIINDYEIDEFYQDTCLADYEGNIHTPLRVLCETVPKEKRDKIYCMHLDCDELIERAELEGFNVVEVSKE